MQILKHALSDPADQLALDESLLLMADEASKQEDSSAKRSNEVIRVWQFRDPVVVVGRSSRVAEEVDVAYCQAESIPVFRRCTGGASIVAGPGCLMYSVVLDVDMRPTIGRIDLAHEFVMQRVLQAVRQQLPDVAFQGTCDLTFQNKKFSGNSMRMVRHHVLYHGTILYAADLDRIARCLRTAPRQPDYRQGREHSQFITNIPVNPEVLEQSLYEVFGASEVSCDNLPVDNIAHLRETRYSNHGWNFLR
ncbi:putative lipoate-protein ligase A [Planctomycetes bacterium CA13]|uniref:Putative lipoate-protein ligase A n=1 Tax=Novipirellula herctigrandis TaxID=2527986 RepID=A0A5C5YXR2_9BACT|nr:putative lipoate-protein ligase A [Planctomycetes bacterium CA13]